MQREFPQHMGRSLVRAPMPLLCGEKRHELLGDQSLVLGVVVRDLVDDLESVPMRDGRAVVKQLHNRRDAARARDEHLVVLVDGQMPEGGRCLLAAHLIARHHELDQGRDAARVGDDVEPLDRGRLHLDRALGKVGEDGSPELLPLDAAALAQQDEVGDRAALDHPPLIARVLAQVPYSARRVLLRQGRAVSYERQKARDSLFRDDDLLQLAVPKSQFCERQGGLLLGADEFDLVGALWGLGILGPWEADHARHLPPHGERGASLGSSAIELAGSPSKHGLVHGEHLDQALHAACARDGTPSRAPSPARQCASRVVGRRHRLRMDVATSPAPFANIDGRKR